MNDDRTDALDLLCIAVLILLVLGMGITYMIESLKRRAELAIGNVEAAIVRHPTKAAIVVSAASVAIAAGLVVVLA